MAIAVTFAGQGSQRAGMSLPWRDHPAAARWEQASDLLGWDVKRLGTGADADELRRPRNCQVALFVHQAVVWDAWHDAHGDPLAAAGHSLGEYNALVAAGVLGFADGLRLVDARARATEEAAARMPGGMVACLGADPVIVHAACQRAGAHIANDNAPGQLTVAGGREALAQLATLLAGHGRLMALEVGAAYHSPHMASAEPALTAALDEAGFGDGRIPVVANVDARPHAHGAEWPDLLRRQITAPVNWRQSVHALAELGTDRLVELSASPVLTGLAKRIDPQLGRSHVATPADLAMAA